MDVIAEMFNNQKKRTFDDTMAVDKKIIIISQRIRQTYQHITMEIKIYEHRICINGSERIFSRD